VISTSKAFPSLQRKQSRQLPDFHGDPADRIIVATAITLGIPLITADKMIIRWNGEKGLLQVIEI
jgi:PIN domain nuclease of toxin-antitoxin system